MHETVKVKLRKLKISKIQNRINFSIVFYFFNFFDLFFFVQTQFIYNNIFSYFSIRNQFSILVLFNLNLGCRCQ